MAENIKEKKARIRNIVDTTENWKSANPILLSGEIGFEITSDKEIKIKIGDGITTWGLLEYITNTPKELQKKIDTLQSEIDNIVITSSEGGDVSAEVAQARVNANGETFITLKARLDTIDVAIMNVRNELKSLSDSAVFTEIEEGTEGTLFRFGEDTKQWQTQTSSISDGIAKIDISNATTVEISAFFIANDLYATFEFLDENNEHISWGNTYSEGVTPDTTIKFLYDYTIHNIPDNAKYIRVVKFNNNSASDNFYVKLSYSIKGKVDRIQNDLNLLKNQVNYKSESYSEVEEGTEGTLFRFDSEDTKLWQTQTSSISDGIAKVDISNALIIEISAFFIVNNLYATYEFLDENNEHISWGNTYSDGITPDSEKKWLYDYIIPSIPSNAKYIRVVKFNNNSASDNFYVKVYGVKGKFNEIHSQINRIDNEITDIRLSINEFDYNRVLKVAELSKNKKFDLFVFAGQSNMMGASAIPPESTEETLYSYEYKYNPKLKGETFGSFEHSKHSAGEWSYKDMTTAYATGNVDTNGKSTVTNYANNTYFVSSISNGGDNGTVKDFSTFSESTATIGSSIAPCLAREYASYGNPCIYAHMAKGSTGIEHYLDSDVKMFFANKYNSMVQDFASVFADCSIKSKSFIWCQGETDGNNGMSKETYKAKLSQLWTWLKSLGFQNFFCIRVGYWGKDSIKAIMQAQEEFCNENNNCYIITRAMSYMLWLGQETSNWFITQPDEKTYGNCRDSYYGYNNNHINEKGHKLIAKVGSYNINRVINENNEPDLEPENIVGI